MDKAKAAVTDFLSKDGKHRTSVHQQHSQAVTEEHIRPHRHEEVATAVDREVHKDHHYTTIQPISHTETLPEQHHHNVIPVEHKTIDHGGVDEMNKTLETEAAKYVDASTTHDTTHSTTTVPVVTGEHVHHHVHEHVQPIIQKETIQPHVVHTVIPIHETHNVPPVHHGTKIAPIKTLEEFTSGGGLMEGSASKDLREYEGCPQAESSSGKTSHKGAMAAAAATTAAGAAALHKHKSDKKSEALDSSAATRDSSLGTTALGSSQTTRGKDVGGFNNSATGTEDVSNLADTLNSHGTRSSDVNETTNSGSAGKVAAAGTAGVLASETATSRNDKHGSMFGRDKMDTLDDTNTSAQNSTESRSFLKTKNKKENNVLKKERPSDELVTDSRRTGADNMSNTTDSATRTSDVSDADNYKAGTTDSAYNTENTTKTTGLDSVPRSEAAMADNTENTEGMEPWRAGETHQIAEKVHAAGVQHRASLMSKINPFKDSDGDGKKGFMK
uniref:Allergen n=1 Tax=Anthurium amnicola TaxID=1678845 RepID=A0A1D1Y0L1_9ARAE